MDPILSFFHKHEQNLLAGLGNPENSTDRENLERMTRGLRGCRALFKTLDSARPQWLPPSSERTALRDLMRSSEHLTDLYVLADTIKETEVICGMDLSYLHQYIMHLAGEKKEGVIHAVNQIDNQFPRQYSEYLAAQLEGTDSDRLQGQLVHLTHKKVKKALQRIKKKQWINSLQQLRRNLIDAVNLLDMLGFEGPVNQLTNASLFLEILYNRKICLNVMKAYRRDYPGQARRYKGTFEILEDYMQHKVGTN